MTDRTLLTKSNYRLTLNGVALTSLDNKMDYDNYGNMYMKFCHVNNNTDSGFSCLNTFADFNNSLFCYAVSTSFRVHLYG